MKWSPRLIPLLLLISISCGRVIEFEAEDETGGVPALLLLCQLSGEGVTVEGVISSELYFDMDEEINEDSPFIYRIYRGEELLYSDSLPQPVMVQEFLSHYGEDIDLISLLPELGRFYLTIPDIEGAESIRFSVRRRDGSEEETGYFDLSEAPSIEKGIHEGVISFETIYSSGPHSNRLDIAILGDGYTEEEMDKFHEDAGILTQEILGRSPFSEYGGYLNIHRVDAASSESGASYDCDGKQGCEEEIKRNAFGSIFIIALVNELMGTNYDDRVIMQLYQWEVARAAAAVPFDTIMLIVNSEKDGGFAVYHSSFTSGSSDFPEVGTHELGHSLGWLGDEYVYDECIKPVDFPLPPNISEYAERGEIKWGVWIEEDTPVPTPDTAEYSDAVGLFEGAYNCPDLYRPWRNCKMRTDVGDFCPVCREQLSRRLYRFTDPFDTPTLFLQEEGKTYLLHGDPIRDDLSALWNIDGRDMGLLEAGEPLVIEKSFLEGRHEIVLTLFDQTEFVRQEDDRLSETLRFSLDIE